MRPRRDLVAVAAAFTVAATASTAGVAASTGVAVAVACAVAATAAVSLFLDPFGGAVVGLVAAAAVILGQRIAGDWDADTFALALVQTVALVSTGGAAGRAGAVLRREAVAPAEASLVPEPVFGSLGLLDADIAMERLEEEIDRSRAHARPLSVVVIDVRTTVELSAEARRAALRAVARLFESRLFDSDVPFALSESRLAALLPDADPTDAWERIGLVLDAVAAGRFSVRDELGDRRLTDTVELAVGMAESRPDTLSADAILDAATAALPSDRAEDPA